MDNNIKKKKIGFNKKPDEFNKIRLFDRNKYYTYTCASDEYTEGIEKNIEKKMFVNHWGQLKLLASEIQFFNLFLDYSSKNRKIILYAGASPGNHIYSLYLMFPEIEFHLYDPIGLMGKKGERFADNITELYKNNDERMKLYGEYFTDEIAIQWRERKDKENLDIYFICDIRGRDKSDKELLKKKGVKEEDIIKIRLEDENNIAMNMESQRNWLKIIRPTKSLLKFRPFKLSLLDKDSEEYTKRKWLTYLEGFCFRQIFNKRDSWETRLVPYDNITTTEWNIEKYNSMITYHNNVLRPSRFMNPILGDGSYVYTEKGFKNNFDSVCFATILIEYFTKFEGVDIRSNKDLRENLIKELIDKILVQAAEDNKLIEKRVFKKK